MAKLRVGDEEVEGDLVPFVPIREDWNEYRAGDYIVKMKSIVSEMFRAKDKIDAAGNPVFFIQTSQVTTIRKVEQ